MSRRIKKGASLFLFSHHDSLKQQDFIFVLKGSFQTNINENTYVIHEEDNFYFYSSQNHLFTNIPGGHAQCIWAVNEDNKHLENHGI